VTSLGGTLCGGPTSLTAVLATPALPIAAPSVVMTVAGGAGIGTVTAPLETGDTAAAGR